VLVAARPNDDEVPAAIHADRRQHLEAGRERVDLKLRAESGAVAREPAAEDAVGVAVLIALPDDDEAAAAVHCDRRGQLIPRRVAVDLELGAHGNRLRSRGLRGDGDEKAEDGSDDAADHVALLGRSVDRGTREDYTRPN